MSTSSCNFKGALHVFLPLYLTEIVGAVGLCLIKFLTRIDDGLLKRRFTTEKGNDLRQMIRSKDLQLINNRSFAHILLGYDKSFVTFSTRLDGYGQCTLNGADRTVQAEFSNKHITVEHGGGHKFPCSHHTDSHRKVKPSPLFAHISRSKVYGCRLRFTQIDFGILKRRSNTRPTFTHGIVGQTYHDEIRLC